VRIGLTGGLAAGKSTVARRFADSGFVVVDADDLVGDLYRSGQPGSAIVRDLFGHEFLDADGAVNRPRLAEKVFAETEALQRLEELIHPLVRKMFSKIAAAVSSPVVLEGTLLVEAAYAAEFDLLVTVEADREKRVERAVARGLTREEAEARLDAQGDGELRRQAAHRILKNNGSREELFAQVDDLVRLIRERHEGMRA
jgi:dephospho-CoA kinase